jgi:Family of unknown function (DUF6467)
LYSLQEAAILTPCCPNEGPSGGVDLALPAESVVTKGSLTVRPTSRAGTKVGVGDLTVLSWIGCHLPDNSFSAELTKSLGLAY